MAGEMIVEKAIHCYTIGDLTLAHGSARGY
jgi:hypothetical protein